MADLPDGGAAAGPQTRDDDDPESPGRSFFSRLFRRDAADDDATPQATAANGAAPAARDLMVNLRKLRQMRVEDVSVPRPEIVAIPQHASLAEVVEAFKTSTLSRLPVYGETLDQPLGLVHLKDMALVYGFGAFVGDFDVTGLIRPLLYAPPSMPIGVLLQKMQAQRIHMALVIDEYGGVDGLVTLEDLLEQVVGDIADEHDVDDEPLIRQDARLGLVADARMPIEDLEKYLGLKLVGEEENGDIDTLGGLVFALAGRIPAKGKRAVHPSGVEFEVLEANPRRIKKLRIHVPAPKDAAEEKSTS